MATRRSATDRMQRWPLLLLLAIAMPAQAQTTTIFFDNEGPEEGITVPGSCCFAVGGANFFGFEGVFEPADLVLTASGTASYRVLGSDLGLMIDFDDPVDSVSFFFVHDPDDLALIGTAWIIDTDGNWFASFESKPMTTPGDPANFISFDPPELIASLRLFGLAAYLDNLTFEVAGGNAAGAVPNGDDVPGVPLRVNKGEGEDVTLTWGDSCEANDTDYAVYEGLLSDFSSHLPVENCTTLGSTELTFTSVGGRHYFLVVPRGDLREGSYGTDSSGTPRPASVAACRDQLVGVCR